ncbi:Hsp70 protein [Streptoalloteichus tenebrarius]|uniref:Hsp70 protein n=1 Tax=Streptoalloteichus tenebrarius (strain ATCC 17920 / DSM 40477 / JCM 4838 / CBS 697.72 / NBRC 16177 / NCIMB 11028 / NRRL B-12390 / A12253. 1 / ISP 5477) TaxID=1933 RepID=A0ABT1HMK5_STRSD|nr:Hsp70 family protein [Streptoalloteichus tenebrarius]MCP2256752.1 Hsp70 protein [Streptoalloteichus tenebrarius]BFF00345.1 Hsp70 family protein [Streptoalloteichus tenebrarius]
MRVLSVDLGTSNTVAVLSAHGLPPRVVEVDGAATMPSAVFAAEDGTLVVGRDAERRARLDPARFEPNPKRRVDEGTLLLGDAIVPVNEALAAVLGRVAEETARQLGGAAPDEVRLTHPAQWGPVRRNVLLGAARLAGLGPQLVLVPEPVAAAAHFASFPDRSLAPGQALAVYDLGAGTFDCAVVGATQNGFVVLAEDGLPDLGGLDVDQALLEHVGRQVSQRDPAGWQRLLRPVSTADRRAQRALREDVKAGKEALSRHPQTEVPLPEPFDDVLVTRTELEGLIRPSLLRSVELLAATIRSTGMTPQSLAGIYLVGGSSRIPLIATLIAEQLGVVPTSLDQPETGVALGAHHVPQDGTSMRTQDLAGMARGGPATGGFAPPTGPTPTPTGPTPTGHASTGPTGGFPSAGYPASTSQQVSAAAIAGAAQGHGVPGVSQPYQGSYGTPPVGAAMPGKKKSRRKPVLIGVAGLLVAVAATVTGVYVANGSSLPTAQECQKPGDKDDKGFTSCLRQLAGKVADGSCSAGLEDMDLTKFTGVTVTCRLKGGDGVAYNVVYSHFDSMEAADQAADTILAMTKGNRVEADWAGNGLRGHYRSAMGTVGITVFTVKDRPLVGYLFGVKAGQGTLNADVMSDYFEKNVQPGT